MATELEPTPGPWATAYRESRALKGYAQEVFDANGTTIAICAWYPVQVSDTTTATNRAANGRLIACAPEMLDALRRCVIALAHASTNDPTYDAAYKAADAAIAKAVGMAANTQVQP